MRDVKFDNFHKFIFPRLRFIFHISYFDLKKYGSEDKSNR